MDEGNLMDARRQCTAKSKRSGYRCRRAPMLGASVCHMHGAAAQQVQRSARQRLAELHDPAIRTFARAMESTEFNPALKAASEVLKHSIDYVPPVPVTSPAAVNFDRLSVDELELLTVLIAKLEGQEARYDTTRLYKLTIGPAEWLLTQPGSDLRYPVMNIRLEAVPDQNARPTTGLLPAGQGDVGSDVGNTTVNAADIATEYAKRTRTGHERRNATDH